MSDIFYIKQVFPEFYSKTQTNHFSAWHWNFMVTPESDGDYVMWWPILLISLILVASVIAMVLQENTKEIDPMNQHNNINNFAACIPFIVMEEPAWRDLSVMLEKYHNDVSNLLRGLSQSLEVALYSEREIVGVDPHGQEFLFSQRLRTQLDRVSTALEHNEQELIEIMKPYPALFVLPQVVQKNNDGNRKATTKKKHCGSSNQKYETHIFTLKNQFGGMGNLGINHSAYDCGAQIIAHIVRDWKVLGQGVRATIYDWCRRQVDKHLVKSAAKMLPILVPGAGLGRLAHDLAFVSGYAVEANEIAVSMTTAAHAILQQNKTGTFYPFALDSYANEVESERRYDKVSYTDVNIHREHYSTMRLQNGSLSYTAGDFVQIYRWQRPQATFDCIVTCFFLDTATNVYEYISTIEHSLQRGGIWVNIGPLRWHRNSMLHPAADELRTMIESSFYSFDVLEWSVDESPSEYRHEDPINISDGHTFVRSTSYEAYRPLRFVARRI